jgi:eukaryotic-like serine/threonine-protein kinase
MTDSSIFDTLFARVEEQLELSKHSSEDSIRPVSVTAIQLTTVLLNAGSKGLQKLPKCRDRLPRLDVEADSNAAFEIKETLGAGGMGKVELAVQHSLGREVAVKRALNSGHEDISNALLLEARISGLLDHPNIIPVHELGLDADGAPVIVMKRVVGDAWRDLLRNKAHPRWKSFGRDPLRLNLEILRDVCNAVYFAHNRGILHRDIKPENVMIGEFGEVYLVDWGLALALADRDVEKTAVVGTPAYIAPEMLEGERGICEQTDVYLLGSTLHEILTGCRRHQGGAYKALQSAYLSRSFDYDDGVPRELAKLCNRAMNKDKTQRPKSALEFRQGIERFLDHYGSIELTRRAEESLGKLQQALADHETEAKILVTLFAECRFGFEQALRIWPENEPARTGLQDCLEWMIEGELSRRNKGMVAALIAALPEARPELDERLQALERKYVQDASNQQRLENMERDLDLRVFGQVRSRYMIFAALFGGVSLFFMSAFQHKLEFNYRIDSYLTALIVVTVSVAIFFGRRSLFGTTVNRRITMSGVVAVVMVVMNRIAGRSLGLEVMHSLVYDGIIMSTILLMMCNTIDRRLMWIVPVALPSTILAAIWPDYLFQITGIGGVLSYLMLSYIWGADEQDAADPNDNDAEQD